MQAILPGMRERQDPHAVFTADALEHADANASGTNDIELVQARLGKGHSVGRQSSQHRDTHVIQLILSGSSR
jgi:hypothetical protein